MSRSLLSQRTAIVAVLAPIVTAGLVLTAGPAGAIPFEGDPAPTSCVRIVALPAQLPRAAPCSSRTGMPPS